MTQKNQLSWFVKVLLLLSGTLIVLFVVSLILAMIFGINSSSKAAQITAIVLQNVAVFILPVLLLALFCRKVEGRSLSRIMWMSKAPSGKSLLLVLLVFVASIPMMNYIVDWNEHIKLPASMHEIEGTMRAMEDSAQLITQGLLNTTSVEMMVFMVLIVGVLTGMGEEIFFRSGVLGAMHHGRVNNHVAVWGVAILFSAFHLQFYGFVPRMLLGAWFGYLMLWSGEVWTPIIAHSLNNSIVVVMTFLVNNHIVENNILETIGVPQAGEKPWIAIVSAIVTVLVIYLFMRKRKRI